MPTAREDLGTSWPIPIDLIDTLSQGLDINSFFDAITRNLGEQHQSKRIDALYSKMKYKGGSNNGPEYPMRTTIQRSLPKTLNIFLRDLQAAPNWKMTPCPGLEIKMSPEIVYEDAKRKRHTRFADDSTDEEKTGENHRLKVKRMGT